MARRIFPCRNVAPSAGNSAGVAPFASGGPVAEALALRFRPFTRAVSTLLLTVFAVTTMAAPPPSSKIAPDMPASGNVNVIVQYNSSSLLGELLRILSLGGTLNSLLNSVNGLALNLPASLIQILAQDAGVAYISPDRSVNSTLEFANPTVNANIALQYGYDGTGVGIAVIDSGIDAHPDLRATPGKKGPANRAVVQQSFVPGESPADLFGHGTHVAGILIGDGAQSSGSSDIHTFRGIAPNATAISLKVLDKNGNGSDSEVIAAIEEAVALKRVYNIRVINLSLGRPVYESYRRDPLCRAVEWAWKNGIAVVVAAGNNGRDNSSGNNGYGTVTSPGNDPYVITVGAMKDESTVVRSDDRIASYSSKGPTAFDLIVKPDIVAPGNRIVSLANAGTTLYLEAMTITSPDAGLSIVPLSYYLQNGSSSASTDYYRLSGTSMAAPMVSGAAALLIQKDPALTPDQIKAKLMLSATKTFPSYSTATDPVTGTVYTSQYDIFTVGAGYLDVWAALEDNHMTAGSAASPTAMKDASGNVWLADTNQLNSTGQTTVWGSGSDWSNSTVWGSSVLENASSAPSGNSTVWGSTTVWGSSTVWGTGYIGSTTTVWGSGTPSGSSTVWGTGTSSGTTTVWGSSFSLAGEN